MKIPERDPSKSAEQQGLFRKFIVQRVDGSDQPGGKHYGCRYFVLDLDHDQHASAAMRSYAQECAVTHPQLSADLMREFGYAQPAPAGQPQPESIMDVTGLPRLIGNVIKTQGSFDALERLYAFINEWADKRVREVQPAPQAAGNAGEQDLKEMEARKDAAYLERNQVVAALAKCFPSGVARTTIEGWSEDWHGCVYIDLPTGQVSWHFHDSQAHLFDGLPTYQGVWDGHDTPEKYRRVAALRPTAKQAADNAGEEWIEAQRICDLPRVDELFRAFSEDSTGDTATMIVREVLRNARPTATQAAPVPEGLTVILKEAANILATVEQEYSPKYLRQPIIDELEGFAAMLAAASATPGEQQDPCGNCGGEGKVRDYQTHGEEAPWQTCPVCKGEQS